MLVQFSLRCPAILRERAKRPAISQIERTIFASRRTPQGGGIARLRGFITNMRAMTHSHCVYSNMKSQLNPC